MSAAELPPIEMGRQRSYRRRSDAVRGGVLQSATSGAVSSGARRVVGQSIDTSGADSSAVTGSMFKERTHSLGDAQFAAVSLARKSRTFEVSVCRTGKDTRREPTATNAKDSRTEDKDDLVTYEEEDKRAMIERWLHGVKDVAERPTSPIIECQTADADDQCRKYIDTAIHVVYGGGDT